LAYRALTTTLLIFVMLLFAVPENDAQIPLFDQQHPMLEMMRFVPDGPIVYEALNSYINYEALQSTNGVTVDPSTFAEWDSLEDYERSLWIHRSLRWTTGPSAQYIVQQEDAVNVSGFDFFTMSQAVAFGNPPANGFVYSVPLDRAGFESAMDTSRYEQTTIGGLEAWCPVEGCDVGFDQNLRERDPAFIFDNSALGRRPPILVDGDYVATTFPEELAELMAEAYTSDNNSLVDNEDYGALFRALVAFEADAGTLMQMSTIPAEEYLEIDLNDPDTTLEGLPISANNLPSSWQNYGVLPAYTALAMADYQVDSEQIAAVMVVYDNETDAQIAAEELAIRVRDFAGELVTGDGTPFIEILEGTATVNDPQVIADDNGRFVAIASVSYPAPSEEEDRLGVTVDEPAQTPGFLFRRWMNSIFQRSFDIIWSIVPLD